MIALIVALSMQVEFNVIIEKQAAALYITAACQRFMTPRAKGDLDLTQYPEGVRSFYAEAVAMGEEEAPRWTYAKCERSAFVVRKDQAK